MSATTRGDDRAAEFLLLTGALGSGKTTLLSKYLSTADTQNTGVIVNDAGEINVDGAVIEADNRELALAKLSNGCICCSLGNGLQDAIDELLAARESSGLGRLRRIILETSGLAEPAPIVRALSQTRQSEFRLRIVSTLDCLHVSPRDLVPQYAAQLAAAHRIVLTKLDVAGDQRVKDAETLAASINPLATRIIAWSDLDRLRLTFDEPQATPTPPPSMLFSADRAERHERMTVALASWDGPVSWPDLSEWVENFSGHCGEKLLRAKGLIKVVGCDDLVLLNGVGTVFSPPRRVQAQDAGGEGLVLILRDISPAELSSISNSASDVPPSLRLR
ncbi:hypothetical protein N185_16740 [Sinorhizobium sp. GW3]|nr:hypothetical protein N185_16740 [Sinorhizobium sp. GW3]